MRIAITLLALASHCSLAIAQQAFPTGPVTIIVPMTAGGADTMARLIGERVAAKWGHPVIVVNKPGAGTILGTDAVAKAKPDGHTLGVAISALTINPAIQAALPYDTQRDLRGVSLLADAAMVAVMHPSVPASNVAEFIAWARTKKPDEIAYLTPGIGTLGHISGELFQHAAGLKMLHVPYQDSPRAVGDLIAGQGQLFFGLWQSVEPHIKAGKMKPLGVFNPKRLPEAPDVPTISEALAGVETISRLGMIAPAGTPKAIIDKIASDVAAIVQSADIKARVKPFGMAAVGSTPEAYDAVIAQEMAMWKTVLTRAGVKPQ
jgi:tripartite-type tricarboxylate transporter receptor subunit TctC